MLPSTANLKVPTPTSLKYVVVTGRISSKVSPSPTLEVRIPTSGTTMSPKTVIPVPTVSNFFSSP